MYRVFSNSFLRLHSLSVEHSENCEVEEKVGGSGETVKKAMTPLLPTGEHNVMIPGPKLWKDFGLPQ